MKLTWKETLRFHEQNMKRKNVDDFKVMVTKFVNIFQIGNHNISKLIIIINITI